MENYTTNNSVLIKVNSTPANEVAIHAGDTFFCKKCGGKVVFTKDIYGTKSRIAKMTLTNAHAIDCPTLDRDPNNSGVKNAIRNCIVQSRRTRGKERVYDGYRYRVTILTENSFSITDKAMNTVYGAYYQGSRIVLLRA